VVKLQPALLSGSKSLTSPPPGQGGDTFGRNLFNYSMCFDPNGSSSGVFSYISFNIEFREIHTFLLAYTGHKRSRSFSFTIYLGI
jgi:hypothetical protein